MAVKIGYRKEFSVKNPNHVWSELSDKGFLEKLGGYRKDRRTEKEGLTLAGLVQKRMLIPDGYGRGMTYKINENYTGNQGDNQGGNQNVTQDTKRILQILVEESIIGQGILKLIEKNNKITQQEIAGILGCSKSTVVRNMSKMKNVHYKGSGYSGHWKIDK
jgi:predicted XRE-type DNA-binding protein